MAVSDPGILSRIGSLIEEERQLRGQPEGLRLENEELVRLEGIETELDQCWDLLNQRRALADAGEDPGQARVRDADTVENYLQ